ncbi:transposase [Verrucomicrobiales bacterium]|nr:transposase [Verrucomicrobiales bacterium]
MIVWDLIERTQKMRGKRHTTEERIRILRKADGGKTILDVCREHNISEQTFHRWKREFGMMEVSQAKRLNELEKENARLKKIVADQVPVMEILQEALEKSCEPGSQAVGRRAFCRGEAMRSEAGLPLLPLAPIDDALWSS